ncbi:MAG: M23 family metallopeptidase [Enterococcus casseliflavus]
MKEQPITIGFPLRGEWLAPTTPAEKIPSHGTDRMGLRYAFDFLQVNFEGKTKAFHNRSFLRYFFLGVPLESCYCWGEKIYAPCDGEVIVARDGYRERKIVHWIRDFSIAVKNGLFFNEQKDDYQQIAGNYIVIKASEGVYMAFVHLQNGSVNVSVGQNITKGMVIGSVGHSGNSTSPHLHFQVMDTSDIAHAKGLPCRFEEYEVYQAGGWTKVQNRIPGSTDRIRLLKED